VLIGTVPKWRSRTNASAPAVQKPEIVMRYAVGSVDALCPEREKCP
jgi:hypothetical protein